jgi:hypothetical protein
MPLPILALALAAVAAATVAVAAGKRETDSEPDRPPRRTIAVAKGAKRQAKHIREKPHTPRPDIAEGTRMLQWSRMRVGGRAEAETVYIGDLAPGRYEVNIYALAPNIDGYVRFPTKPGKKNYGYNDAPPGGAGVAGATVGVVNGLLKIAAPAADAAAGAYGIPPGVITAAVNVVTKVLGLIPDAIERSRVKTWSKFRMGLYGDSAERSFMRTQVARWLDPNVLWAMGKSSLLRQYHYEGAEGELRLMDAPPAAHGKQVQEKGGFQLANPPTVALLPKAGTDHRRLEVVLPPTTVVPGGERRIAIIATPMP